MTKVQKISAEVPESILETLKTLAAERGVSANTVLQQAIVNEKFISDRVAAGEKILVEKPDKTLRRIEFDK